MSTSDNTHYHARYYGSTADAYQLYRYNSGTATLLGSYATGVADEATRALVLAVSGSATVDLSVTVDGTERIATSDSSGSRITDAGKAGIRLLPGTTPSDDNAIHIDNFSADDLGGSAPTLSDLKTVSITATTVQATYDYAF